MDTYLLMLSKLEIIIFLIVIAVLLLAFIIGGAVLRKSRKRELIEVEDELNMYCDLWHSRLVAEAESKYSLFIKRGYQGTLPDPREAISKDDEMQRLLDRAESIQQEKKILQERLPEIIFHLVIYKKEGCEGLQKKEAAHLKRLMEEYGV